MIDIKEALKINAPIYVVGTADVLYENYYSNNFLLGGGNQSNPKLYSVSESTSTILSSYELTGII